MVPREILDKVLPPAVGDHPDVRGKKGSPNIWDIPSGKHTEIHEGAGGGAYNRRWKEELDALGHSPTVDDVLAIRDKLAKEFDLEQYRP
jgi:hypothetical protein